MGETNLPLNFFCRLGDIASINSFHFRESLVWESPARMVGTTIDYGREHSTTSKDMVGDSREGGSTPTTLEEEIRGKEDIPRRQTQRT